MSPSRRLRSCVLPYLGLLLLAAACAPTKPANAALPASTLQALSQGRWEWVSADCVDGTLELGKQGFERALRIEVQGSALRFTYDSSFVQPACVSTDVWTLTPEQGGQWQLTPEAHVVLPASTSTGGQCGAFSPAVAHGVLRATGDTLQELVFGSPWCRGFDARFTYRRLPAAALDEAALMRHYVAHWNRRDASAVAALFAEQGVLIEPFTRTDDGGPARHENREQVRVWLSQAFATTPWLGLQLTAVENLERGEQAGQWLASWRYMDARLASPVSGRNLFVVAAGEIFASEIQLLSEPEARVQPAAP